VQLEIAIGVGLECSPGRVFSPCGLGAAGACFRCNACSQMCIHLCTCIDSNYFTQARPLLAVVSVNLDC